jgi:hypothetical protein
MRAPHFPARFWVRAHADDACARPQSIRTLREAALVFFGRPSPRLLGGQLALLLALRLAVADFGAWDLAVLALVAVYWPVQEWVLHVHILHMNPLRMFGRTIDPLIARMHRKHHRQPWNLDYVFLPIAVLLPLVPINVLVWWATMPTPGLALTGMMSLGAAALLYEWIHYLTHTGYRPRRDYYRRVWRGHRLHHFKNERFWHAFTLPGVDRLMGTAPDPATVELSPTCRTLGREDDG